MTMIPRDTVVPAEDGLQHALERLATEASGLGYEIVDIAGFLDQVAASSNAQVRQLSEARATADRLLATNDEVRRLLEQVEMSTGAAVAEAEGTTEYMRFAGTRTTSVLTWVADVSTRLRDVDELLTAVRGNNTEIASIAAQINILAINAKIEAARAGDAGRGFAVVAEAINELSRKTSRAAAGIAGSVEELGTWCQTLTDRSTGVRQEAEQLIDETRRNDAVLQSMSDSLKTAQDGCRELAGASDRSAEAIGAFRPAFEAMSKGLETMAAGVVQARERADGLVDRSERIVQGSVAAGGTSSDGRFIARVQADAAALSAALEEAVASGRITMADLFSERYEPVSGTDPQQVMTPFTELTDALFPAVQEPALGFDRRVVFCAAVDRNGYLPTHNAKFSQPQGTDPVWNAANSRNRRMFNDRVGLKAGRSTEPFLLQVYRRDMGGGEFKMMKDLSAPIRVKGRHWGGLRLAYTF